MLLPFAAVSFFLFSVAGCGLFWFLAPQVAPLSLRRPFWLVRSGPARNRVVVGAREVFVACALGLAFNHLLVLAGLPLKFVWTLTFVLGLAGFALFARTARRAQAEKPVEAETWLCAGTILCGSACIVLMSFANQIFDWDARSIWFFHSRIIYYAGGFSRASGWSDPALSFAHMDYPKLVAALGAELASFADFWNEYLPKASLGVLFAAATAGFLGFARQGFLSLLLFAIVCVFFQNLLWNGYVDSYLAVFTLLAHLYLGRFLVEGAREDLEAGLAALFLLPLLKNEGMLIALISGAALPVFRAVAGRAQRQRAAKAISGMKIRLALLAAPTLLWFAEKSVLHLKSDLSPTRESLAAAVVRLHDSGTVQTVLGALYSNGGLWRLVWLFATMLALAAVDPRFHVKASGPMAGVVSRARHAFSPAVVFSLACAAIYFGALALVYLFTPHKLSWHLGTSADRTSFAVSMMVLAATFSLLVPRKR